MAVWQDWGLRSREISAIDTVFCERDAFP